MTRPLIGIATSLNEGEQRLRCEYVDAVVQAGGTPVVLPMTEDPSDALPIIDLLHGLIVTGGPAIQDGLIGELPTDISATDNRREENDRFALEHMIATQRPYLGICYGMQLLNAVHGGTIYADVERQRDGTAVHSEKRGGNDHDVRFAENSRLHEIWGESVSVNTRHLQAVAEVGAGLKATAHAPDGVIEGLEDASGLFVGVQFHPERMGEEGLPIFRYLVQLCRNR
ncbi:gamma-glutamyl-gamma-aminobutyrate hydrolase [soil metagenome]